MDVENGSKESVLQVRFDDDDDSGGGGGSGRVEYSVVYKGSCYLMDLINENGMTSSNS